MQTSRHLAFLVLLLTAPVFAQSMTVNPSGSVQSGARVSIDYANSSSAGKTIVVLVTGGDPATTQPVTILLDSDGRGTGSWTAPANWTKAYFNAPGVAEQSVIVY